jgi:hypothetical protein
MQSLRLFAERVMPVFRPTRGTNNIHTEFGANVLHA